MTQIMIRLPVMGLLLCALTGCSSLPSLNRALIRGEPKVVAEPQPSLADPRDQELAIAWETARLAEQRAWIGRRSTPI